MMLRNPVAMLLLHLVYLASCLTTIASKSNILSQFTIPIMAVLGGRALSKHRSAFIPSPVTEDTQSRGTAPPDERRTEAAL